MRKLVPILLACIMLCGCSSDGPQEGVARALTDAKTAAESMLETARQGAEYGINSAGAALNLEGDYGSTAERLAALTEDFKSQVTSKIEEMNPEQAESIKMLVGKMTNVANECKEAFEEANVEDTQAYAFFENFDDNNYDITYIVYSTDKTVVRNRVVKSGDDAYCSSFAFNLGDKQAVFDLFGLTFSARENGVWYDCNQLTKQKTAGFEPVAYETLEGVLQAYNKSAFKSSTLSNLINDDLEGYSVDCFETDTTISFVCKDGVLQGALISDGPAILITNITNDVDETALNASCEYLEA